jgi:hypothetical protein
MRSKQFRPSLEALEDRCLPSTGLVSFSTPLSTGSNAKSRVVHFSTPLSSGFTGGTTIGSNTNPRVVHFSTPLSNGLGVGSTGSNSAPTGLTSPGGTATAYIFGPNGQVLTFNPFPSLPSGQMFSSISTSTPGTSGGTAATSILNGTFSPFGTGPSATSILGGTFSPII